MTAAATPAVVLAAGHGSRFAHGHKLLADFHGVPVLIATLDAVRCATDGPVVLVLGRNARALRRVIAVHAPAMKALRIVWNPAWRSGMARSLGMGIQALPSDCARALVALADMPVIDPAAIRRLIAMHNSQRPETKLVRPVHAGRPGHPSLIDHRLFAPIARLTGDQGAQPVLAALPPAHIATLAADARCVQDVDTRARLRTLRHGQFRQARLRRVSASAP